MFEPVSDAVFDGNGVELKVGMAVKVGDEANDRGVITEVSEPDGDVDDYGRSIGINPAVSVQFPDCDDRFVSFWDWQKTNRWVCDDVEAVPGD
jgi:hypothetical protein